MQLTKPCSRLSLLQGLVYCNSRIVAVTLKESRTALLSPSNEQVRLLFRILCPVFMFHLIHATQAADKTRLRVLGGRGVHNDVTHRKYQRGGLGTSQDWLFFHGLASSSRKINRQSEYGTRVHNDIVDFHA